jgi:hypothetical protein
MLHLLLLVLLSNFLIAAGPVSAASLSFDQKYWKKILHFQKDTSLADGEKFFLSPNGKNDPDAELAATIKAFSDQQAKAGWFNYHPQCVFRERFFFLKSQGLLEGIPEVSCAEFDEWKKGLNAESVSLIFSSSYPNNPSSLFGHTLLRLNQKNVNGKKNDLLDYAVAFSAVPEKEDLGIIFALKGMFGGYKGLFEITKYYTKVNEYNNGESRDLIEYNLSMTPEELDRMINHLWELYQTTYFDYYFTDENCSAVLADLLAVAYKDDERVNAHSRWYYLPGEMIKHFQSLEGRITSVNYRPSLKKQVAKMWEKLSPSEIDVVKTIVDEEKLPENITNPKILDSVISYLDFTHYRTKNKLKPELAKLQRNVLIKRSTLPKAVETLESYDQSNRPENSHDPQKFSFFTQLIDERLQTGFEFKQGYHDLLSRDVGFDSFSQFDFLGFSALYDYKKKTLSLNELMIVNLISLHEYRFYDPQLSWRAKVSYERFYDLPQCSFCKKANVLVLGGYTFKFFNNKSVLNLLAGAFGEASSDMVKGYRAGPASEISFYAQLGESFKTGLFNEIRFDATKKIKSHFTNQLGFRQAWFFSEQNDLRYETTITSKHGSFSQNNILHKVSYGHFF